MRRHPIIVIILGAGLCVFVGYYVHLKLASVPPPLPATTSSGNYSPEQFHHALSNTEKDRVLDGEFRVVRATEEMPLILKQAFAAATGEQQFALANPGQKYQVTDVIDEPGLPFRRLLFAGESQKTWFIQYEHGGIGHGYAVLVFSKAQKDGLQFFWGGAGSESAKDLNDLRNKIAAGNFRDNLASRCGRSFFLTSLLIELIEYSGRRTDPTSQQPWQGGHLIRVPKMDKSTVLSFSTDRNSLVQRECALRNGGFEVISVESEIQARFEIEMGRCGVLLICFRARPSTTQELTNLFRHSCPNGTIIFVMRPTYEVPTEVDYIVPESDEPDAIVQALRSDPQLESRAS